MSKPRSTSPQTCAPGVFSSCLPLVVPCLLLLMTSSGDPVDGLLPDPPSEGLVRCQISSGVLLLRRLPPKLTLFLFRTPLGQESLSRPVISLPALPVHEHHPLTELRWIKFSIHYLLTKFPFLMPLVPQGLHNCRVYICQFVHVEKNYILNVANAAKDIRWRFLIL